MPKQRTTTEVVTKAMARSGPSLHPNQIRLDDSVQTDKTKVLTQSDINSGMSGGGGGGGGGGGVAPEDLAHLATKEELSTESGARETGDKANLGLIEANKKDIASINSDYTTTGEFNTLNGTVTQNKKDIASLGEAFDTAVIAAQEGAETLEIELQSYAKKEDLPEGVGPDARLPYELAVGEQDSTDLLKEGAAEVGQTQVLETLTLKDGEGTICGGVAFESGGGIGVAISQRFDNTILIQGSELEKAINANAEAIAAIEIPEAPEYKTPSLDDVCQVGYVTNKALGVKGINTSESLDARGKFEGVDYAKFYGSDSKADLKIQDNIVTVGDNTRDAGATLNVIGTVNATEFVGDGSKLTGLPTPTYIDWSSLPNLTV